MYHIRTWQILRSVILYNLTSQPMQKGKAMSRSRTFTRYQRRAHISRKKRIIAEGNNTHLEIDMDAQTSGTTNSRVSSARGRYTAPARCAWSSSMTVNRRGIFAEWIRWSTRIKHRKESKSILQAAISQFTQNAKFGDVKRTILSRK